MDGKKADSDVSHRYQGYHWIGHERMSSNITEIGIWHSNLSNKFVELVIVIASHEISCSPREQEPSIS